MKTTLHVKNGRPTIYDGSRAYTAIYSETYPKGMHRRNRQMAEAGADLFMLIVRGDYGGDFHTSYFWRGPGEFGDESDRNDGYSLNAQANEILKASPEAHFLVRWGSSVPRGWTNRYPGEAQASETRKLNRASYASRIALKSRKKLARRIVNYCEKQSWGDRVIGYIPFGPDEGQMRLTLHYTLFDQSEGAKREYLRYLKEKYKTNEALQKAWDDKNITFETVALPTAKEWENDRANWMQWPEPSRTVRYRDYFLSMRANLIRQTAGELRATRQASDRPVLVGTDAFKQPMSGWLIEDAFHAAGHGNDWRNVLINSTDAAEMLDRPELDVLVTPADYTARSCGFGWDGEGIGDSLVLRSKTLLIEDDARSWASSPGRQTQGAWRNPREARAGLTRNLVIAASRGLIPYWMNVGKGFFDDPELLRILKKQMPLRRKLLTRKLERTEHAVAMIIDDTSPLYSDFTAGFENLAVLRQRTDHLGNTGLPWRVYLLSDLERDNFPRYRCYLLPNLYHINHRKEKLIREKLFRDGSVIIFGPSTGITDGTKRSAAPVSDLLGIPMEIKEVESARRVLVYGGNHPALAELNGPITYGDSYSYGPVLQPSSNVTEHGAVELGKVSAWWESNRAGLVLKEFGRGASGNGQDGKRDRNDFAVVFSMAVPLPARLIRSLAIYGGCTPWADPGDVVAANGNMVGIHSVRGGQHTLTLPRPCNIIDAETGQQAGRRARTINFQMESPGTRVFLLDPPE
ncbi:MAG: hypothetical protein ACLFWL_04030 [Candidatus Brocadiia bacterium]